MNAAPYVARSRVSIASVYGSRHSSGKSYLGEERSMARHSLSRRGWIAGTASLAGAAIVGGVASAQNPPPPSAQTGTAPSVVSNPPRDWTRGRPSTIYPDPDVVVVDPSFRGLVPGNTAIHRLWTGAQW